MVPGAPDEARWHRVNSRRAIDAPLLQRLVQSALPGRRVIEVRALIDGLRNSNFRLRLDSAPESIVLRIYEHDPSLCQKEIDLLRLVNGSVPVPEVIYAQPRRADDVPPFTLARYVEGISFRDVKRTGDTGAIADAAYAVGEMLAAIGRITFRKPGWLTAGPAVSQPLLEGKDATARFVDQCLASADLQERVPPNLRDRINALTWSWAPKLAALDRSAHLVHGDFNRRNVLLRCVNGAWTVAAVLDWEFALSGSPLIDIANFLRYERVSSAVAEPHFSNGYLDAGGVLPVQWRHLARLVDLAALCESLTHEQLPDDVAAELVDLVRATVEDSEPQF